MVSYEPEGCISNSTEETRGIKKPSLFTGKAGLRGYRRGSGLLHPPLGGNKGCDPLLSDCSPERHPKMKYGNYLRIPYIIGNITLFVKYIFIFS
jgi:hypothetical protein